MAERSAHVASREGSQDRTDDFDVGAARPRSRGWTRHTPTLLALGVTAYALAYLVWLGTAPADSVIRQAILLLAFLGKGSDGALRLFERRLLAWTDGFGGRA